VHWPIALLVAEPKFRRDRVDSLHRTTIADRSFVTDAVEKGKNELIKVFTCAPVETVIFVIQHLTESLGRPLVRNWADHVSPYVILGPLHQRLLKNSFCPSKRLFQHGVIPGSSQTKLRESAL
jgi:hypothetical protein